MAFWAPVTSPLLVIGVALLIGGVLDLFGADCVSRGSNPMALDNDVCNHLGRIQSGVGFNAIALAIVLVPVALITGAAGALQMMSRRSA
jgi:hypothetical protein